MSYVIGNGNGLLASSATHVGLQSGSTYYVKVGSDGSAIINNDLTINDDLFVLGDANIKSNLAVGDSSNSSVLMTFTDTSGTYVIPHSFTQFLRGSEQNAPFLTADISYNFTPRYTGTYMVEMTLVAKANTDISSGIVCYDVIDVDTSDDEYGNTISGMRNVPSRTLIYTANSLHTFTAGTLYRIAISIFNSIGSETGCTLSVHMI
jgi:hypothetical protein